MFCFARIAALRNLYEVCANYSTSFVQYKFGVGYRTPRAFSRRHGMRLWAWYAIVGMVCLGVDDMALQNNVGWRNAAGCL